MSLRGAFWYASVTSGGSTYSSTVAMRTVVRGDGAFLETTTNFADYADAIKRKLLRELTPQLAER